MRTFAAILLVIVALWAGTAAGQSNNDVHTYLLARTGFRSGKAFTYRYLESFQERGRWVYPDVGYIDFGEAKRYRELFIGAGGTVFSSKHLTFIEEGMIDQSFGPASQHATYFIPWSFAPYHIRRARRFRILAATPTRQSC